MHRQRSTIAFTLSGVTCLGLLAVALGFQTASANGQVRTPVTAKATVVNVTVGKPTELAFTLSKLSSLPVGPITFKVKNVGAIGHDFKICTKPTTSTTANSCVGKTTAVLKPGQSTTLTVTLAKGEFEFLCTVPGHATAGMKGLLGVGVKIAGAAGTPTTTTAAGSSGSAGSTSSGGSASAAPPTGDPVAGAAVFASAGCTGCHTLKAAGSTGTTGPNLDTLAPSQSLVYTTVTNGAAGAMPPFSGTLTVQQIANVAAYVFQSTH